MGDETTNYLIISLSGSRTPGRQDGQLLRGPAAPGGRPGDGPQDVGRGRGAGAGVLGGEHTGEQGPAGQAALHRGVGDPAHVDDGGGAA